MALKLQTAPTSLPVTLDEAKLQLRVDGPDEDDLISAFIASATAEAEHLMGRAVMPQKWQLTLDAFFDPTLYQEPVPLTVDLIRGPNYVAGASALNLSRPTVTAVDTVKYVDATGALITLPNTEYQLANASDYSAILVPAYGKSWPATRAQREAVQVVFSCGYLSAAVVPDPIKAWIRLRVGAYYQNRQAWTVGKAIEQNPFIDFLLDRYRVWSC